MELSIREDLIITKEDKCEATVIWGIDEYQNEANKEIDQKLQINPFENHLDIIINSLDDMVRKSYWQRNISKAKKYNQKIIKRTSLEVGYLMANLFLYK